MTTIVSAEQARNAWASASRDEKDAAWDALYDAVVPRAEAERKAAEAAREEAAR